MVKRIMLFGDSHLAALKSGLDLVTVPNGLEVSFWGTAGTRFRHISWKDGCIVPDDDETEQAFARFSGDGVTRLDPSLYDAVVFVGTRIRPGAVIPDLLNHIAHPARHLTGDYVALVLAEHLLRHSTYQMASQMAEDGKTRVFLNPISFETLDKKPKPRAYKIARTATADHIAGLWNLMARLLAEDGITLIPQPVDTVVEGYYTDPVYGVPGNDDTHKNAQYGSLILRAIFAAVQKKPAKTVKKAS